MKKYHDKKNVPDVAYLRVKKTERKMVNRNISVKIVIMYDDEK